MLVERRRSAFPLAFFGRVGIAWALVSAFLVALNWGAITTLSFPDPDDMMRLIQVRDLLAGQSWFDVTQTRVDAPGGGVAMHWSRLVDAPLALVILVLTPLFGSTVAEMVAATVVPLMTLGVVMLLAARIAWRLMGDEEATLTSLVIAISIPVLFQLSPMRIDHHGWQLACALAAVNGLMARSSRVGGWVIGGAFATWLSISVEGLPLAAVVFALLALRWLRNRGERAWLVSAIQSLAIVSGALFVLTRGLSDFAAYCDAISPVHLGMFAWGAIALTLFARFEPAPRGVILFGFALAGGGALSILLMTAPQCASGGGFAGLDPLVAQYWHANVLEGMPMWHQVLAMAAQYVVAPLIGLGASISLAGRSHGWLRRFWCDYAVILAGAILVSLFIARAGAVACVLAAPPLAWQVRGWLRATRKMDRPAPRMAAMVAIACALLPALPAMLLTSAIPARASIGAVKEAPLRTVECRVENTSAALRSLSKGEIFAPLDIAPQLLMVSGHTVVATGHHRGDEAMRVVIETAIGSADKARATLRARGSDYVALCPSSGEANTYARLAPEGFVAQLRENGAPEWLEPVELPADNGLRIWRVMPG
jgi:hypothetical protein